MITADDIVTNYDFEKKGYVVVVMSFRYKTIYCSTLKHLKRKEMSYKCGSLYKKNLCYPIFY